MTASPSLTRKLEELRERIATARRLLADGQTLDLAGLEEAVETLCRSIEKLPPESRTHLEHALVNLVDELDRLSDELRAQHSRLGEGLKALATRGRATRAYGKAASTPSK